MKTHVLHRYPFLRLLLLLVAGIWLGDYLFFAGWIPGVTCTFLVGGLLSVAIFLSAFLKRYSLRWVFGCLLLLIGVMGGILRMQYHLQQTACSFSGEEAVYRVRLTTHPEPTERSVRCAVQLPSSQKVLLYFPKDSLSKRLRSGDELLVSTRLSVPVNNGNPDEFDYARYLQRQGISATGFVQSGHWKQVAYHPPASFRTQALACREAILHEYHRLGFEGTTYAVLSALTVGYMDALDDGLLESYSVSGASHVLSLSGLHIGFLYLLIFGLLRLIPGQNTGVRWLRVVVILLSLWSFAFFTGLAPSVVRSVCMFSLIGVAYSLKRSSISLNTLFAAAFFMLLCVPEWLFDVGFQLSFVAVVAIILWQPVIYRWVPVSSRCSKYVWGLMSVSLAAQLGTAPLVVLYFYRFSTHFLLTNLLVVPLASFILYAALAMLLLTPFAWLQSGVVIGVRALVEFLNEFVRWVERLPLSSIDGLWLYPLEVAGIYLVLLLALWYGRSRSARSLLTCLSMVFLLCIFHAVSLWNDQPDKQIRFYNLRNSPLVHCMSGDEESWLVYADTLPDTTRLQKVLAPHWNHLRLETPKSITCDYQYGELVVHNRIISFSGARVCILNDNRWQNKTVPRPLFIDYLYVCKGYAGSLEKLTLLFDVKRVVLDASLSAYRKEKLKHECRRLGIGFVSLSEQGSVRFLL